MTDTIQELRTMSNRRVDTSGYIDRVWKELIKNYFSAWVATDATVLNLGCHNGVFMSNLKARNKFTMDINAEAQYFLTNDVNFINQDY